VISAATILLSLVTDIAATTLLGLFTDIAATTLLGLVTDIAALCTLSLERMGPVPAAMLDLIAKPLTQTKAYTTWRLLVCTFLLLWFARPF